MMHLWDNKKGFSLLEMLLVLAVMSGLLLLFINYTTRQIDQFKRDKAVLQVQHILNAALAYYVDNGEFPPPLTTPSGAEDCSVSGCNLSAASPCSNRQTVLKLVSAGYLPSNFSNTVSTPYFTQYWGCGDKKNFYVAFSITDSNAAVNSQIIAGMLPAGIIKNNVIYASVPVPGQNLNNARSVNFAGLYRNGGCVPKPTCPGTMTPQIMVVPVSVSGMNDDAATTLYPISSFTAYATGGTPNTNTPPVCNANSGASTACKNTSSGGAVTTGPYWRACLQVITDQGVVSTTSSTWGDKASVLAITRCAPGDGSVANPGEYSGSDFSVWTR